MCFTVIFETSPLDAALILSGNVVQCSSVDYLSNTDPICRLVVFPMHFLCFVAV